MNVLNIGTIRTKERISRVKQDIVLWTDSQGPSDDVDVMSNVHALDVNGP